MPEDGGQKLDIIVKFYATEEIRDKIKADTKPGRSMSDVIREALEFYFAHRGKSTGRRPSDVSPE